MSGGNTQRLLKRSICSISFHPEAQHDKICRFAECQRLKQVSGAPRGVLLRRAAAAVVVYVVVPVSFLLCSICLPQTHISQINSPGVTEQFREDTKPRSVSLHRFSSFPVSSTILEDVSILEMQEERGGERRLALSARTHRCILCGTLSGTCDV